VTGGVDDRAAMVWNCSYYSSRSRRMQPQTTFNGRVTEVVDNHFSISTRFFPNVGFDVADRPSFGVTKHDGSSRFSASETWSMWISTQPATSERQSK